jgi:dTDP-4-dehydrorhamnose reductase
VSAFVRTAPRPAYSVLGHDGRRREGIEPIRPRREALEEAFPALLDKKEGSVR